MSKDDFKQLKLNIKFCITKAAGPDPTSQKKAIAEVWQWIAKAEEMFNDNPSLKINPTFQLNTINVPTSFRDIGEAKAFLKDHYDNIVGDSKTEGSLVVAVMATGVTLTHKPDKSCDNSGFGGLSFFPDSVNPLGRKHGIALSLTKPPASFAHELGHMFGLVHSFEKDGGFNKNCNKDFSDKEGGTRNGNRINMMDHGLRDSDDIWMNACQKEKAADHRKRLLTRDGKTDYREL